jgi:hypothetical protein
MESHHLITRETIPRHLALQFFQTLVNCNPEELAIAVDWIKEATITLSLSDCARDLANFSEKRGVKVSQPEPVLEALFSLEGLRSSLNWSGSTLVEYLTDDAQKTKLITAEFDVSKINELLSRFFETSAKLERTLKAQRIYDGLLPNYESCSSLVEFRPVFDETRGKIVNGIIAATLTIEMRSGEPSTEVEKVSVQLDAADIVRRRPPPAGQNEGDPTRHQSRVKQFHSGGPFLCLHQRTSSVGPGHS